MTAVQTTPLGRVKFQGELIVWLTIIALINIPLFCGDFSDRFVFYPEQVAAGEWWRVLTYAFVHVSLYHLLLDALAFLWLWHDMQDLPAGKRWGALLACWGLSLILPLLFSEQIGVHGLSGLSGIGHGLFVFYALDCSRRAKESKDAVLLYVSLLLAAGLVLKSVFETLGGQLFLFSLHFGPIGVPIVETHLGGAVGGILAYFSMYSSGRTGRSTRSIPEQEKGGSERLGLESEVKAANNHKRFADSC